MHADIAAFVARHDLGESQARELDSLFTRHQVTQSAVPTVHFDGYEPVSLSETEPSDEATAEVARIGGRYEDLGPIGMGGMGEIRRVRDVELNRTLAMKTLHGPLLRSEAARTRFREEAQATAQLQHPNIVPVHDIGRHDDGRIWFTMKEVRGRTLAEVIAEVHAASDFRWNPGGSGWTFKRLVSAFLGICHAMAYAHERGVVHRDLKPANAMVGSHGEVYVLDWGLAKVIGRPDVFSEEESVVTHRSATHTQTRMGTVAGTPAYMAPEQARGAIDEIDARTDVYALGSMLYDILSGRPPFEGAAREVIAMVLSGSPEPVGRAGGPPLPPELVEVMTRAMARDPEDRYESARDMAEEVEAWLDGARKREHALAITDRALEHVARSVELGRRADELQAHGDALLEQVEPWRPEADKATAWAMQDQAATLRREADLEQLAVDQGLHGALRVAPDLPEAHAALAERYRGRHARAEGDRDADGMARAESLTRFHADALPQTHQVRTHCTAYLRGDGRVSLFSDPPGAEVLLYRYEARNRRLVEVPLGSMGRTPLVEVPLPMGSYLAVLKHPDRDPVRYPLEVPRQGHWHCVAPGDSEPTPIWLPPRGHFGPDEVYVPAGWFRSGGDPVAILSHPSRRLWCDGLVMRRFCVTNREFMAFLDDLAARGQLEEAMQHVPRERSGSSTVDVGRIYGFDGERFTLEPDADGDLWDPDWPVFLVDCVGAAAWLAWEAERTGRPWRLPGELEWEKAARGVDGRWYPWGDFLDPSWCHMADSHRGRRLPDVVDSYPIDTSPYGVRGMAGNVADWTMDAYDTPVESNELRVPIPDRDRGVEPQELRVSRGGTWNSTMRADRAAARSRQTAVSRFHNLGFRGCYRLDER